MRTQFAVLVAVWSCGGPSAPPPAAPAATPRAAPSPTAQPVAKPTDEPSPALICDREQTLEAERCAIFGDRMHLSREDCEQGFGRPGGPADWIRACIAANATCDAVIACLVRSSDEQAAKLITELRACDDLSSDHAVGVTAADYAAHDGHQLVHFADVRSTKAAPIERCGIADANKWLAQLRCNDGSRPITSTETAEGARVNNVGPGGRCSSIVDLYRVGCPDGSVDIYIDPYVCPRR
jgi:hypothetical protein